jgi:hypothetical protein
MLALRHAARAVVAAGLLASTGAPLGALPTVPAHTAVAPAPGSLRGVFRVMLQEVGKSPVPAAIVLERRDGVLTASLLIDENVSPMRSVENEGEILRATVNTERGPAAVMVRISGDSVAGTITAKKHAWKVTGARSA